MPKQLAGKRTYQGDRSPSRPTGPRLRSGASLADTPRQPQRWREILLALLDAYNWAHATLPKGVSFKTMAERRLFLFSFFRELRSYGYWIDPRSLGTKHLEVMVAAWQTRNLAAGTMQQYLSHLRTFADWIHKPGLVPELSKLTATPEAFQRTYVATKPKTWESKQVIPEQVIVDADRRDPLVGGQLRVQAAFGLRVKEALLLRPHLSVIVVDGQPMLIVERGTKGGRRRLVAIDNDEKRAAITNAKSLCPGLEQSLAGSGRTLVQAYRHFYHVMAQIGVTRAQLGVTAHGLRHSFASSEYKARTGEPAPVNGGRPVGRRNDILARLGVAEQLGHARVRISGAYLGGRQRGGSKT